MAGSWQKDGAPPPGCAVPGGGGARPRLPTVHDALPYTPISSIVPFNPDIMPPPTAAPMLKPIAFSTHEEVNNAKGVLQQLAAGATNAELASEKCRTSIAGLQRLLDPEIITQYRFKKPKLPNRAKGSVGDSTATNAVLSPFARMIRDNTEVSFRYLTPEESPEPAIKPRNQHAASHISISHLATPHPSSRPNHVSQDGHLEEKNTAPSSSHQRLLSVVIPKSLSLAERAEYQSIPEAAAPSTSQYLTPSKVPGVSSASRTANLAQRQKGDIAVQNLQTFLGEVFQAEDQIQPDTSGHVAAYATTFFVRRDTDDGTQPVLLAEAQNRLESALSKVLSLGRLSEIDSEDLSRAQKICEVSAANVASIFLSIDDEWSEQDVDEWLQRAALAENGLSATRCLMRIMAGSAQIKALQSEDYLREALDAMKAVVEGCILPIAQSSPYLGEKTRGDKSGLPRNPKFSIASNNRKNLQTLLNGATRALRHLGELLVKTDFDDTAITTVEYLCKSLVFAENAGTDKDSVFGVKSFESIRRCAIDVLAKVFTKYEEQRQFILQEVLISLEKLPDTKQSARQYQLVDRRPIQPVSALLMRLIQTSATQSDGEVKKPNARDSDDVDGDGEDEAEDEDESDGENIKVAPKKQSAPTGKLAAVVKPLHDAAQSNASYIVQMLLHRAINTSKSSDEPFRRLLDIFTQDFLNVLGLSDWPAAEILLRMLVYHMITIVHNEKSAAPAKCLALELLGVMGSGIIELLNETRRSAQNMDPSDEVAKSLRDMVEQIETDSLEMSDIYALGGPYRVWVEYLNAMGADEDVHLQCAHGYVLMQWATSVTRDRGGSAYSDTNDSPDGLQEKLAQMLQDPKWLDDRSSLQVTTAVGQLAALIVTANSKFCKTFQQIFNILLLCMRSDQVTVRSRSMKSVVTLLEKDPSMLDRNSGVLGHILHYASDSSKLVRESTLGLIQTCITLKPSLDASVYPRIIERTRDAAVGVRKRALKMLKGMYLRNQSRALRSTIADAIISRIQDDEDSISEIARSTIEEIWFQAFYGLKLSGDRALEARLAYGTQTALLIATVDRDDNVMKVLEGLTKHLVKRSKAAKMNVQVCGTMVEILFDGITDNSDIPGTPPQNAILRSLTLFAKTTPELFTAAQLERLEPYTQNLTKSDELEVYRYVITILRHTMPNLSTLRKEFLAKLQDTLLKSCTRLQKPELREVAPCLWTINKMLGNIGRLVNFQMSVLLNVHQTRDHDLSVAATATKVNRLMVIASEFGNACNLNTELASFKAKGKFDWYKGDSVSGLIMEILCGFTSPKQPIAVRRTAIDCICTVSQAWPKQFLRDDVISAFDKVFKDRIPEIETVLLGGLEAFFVAQEVPDESADIPELGTGVATGTERLGRTYVATDEDGAITSLAQRSLAHILRIAVASCDEPAFIAARLVISVNKQGLVHPKESGPALIALETCPNKTVASEAFKEHMSQHLKHESVFEKEYMRAVQQTFEYQSKVIGNAAGSTGSPPSAKMHLAWEVLKTGKAQIRKKFLTNISQKLDFDPIKLDARATTPTHISFVRFCCENLAFFEYDKVDDLLHLLTAFDKLFSSTGSAVAQTIESEVQKLHVDNLLGSQGLVNSTSDTVATESSHPDVSPDRLRQLAVSAQIISLIHETKQFLRRVWNAHKYTVKTKKNAKDAVKVPTRANNAEKLAESYLKRVQETLAPVATEHEQRAACIAFVDLMSVNHEVKIASDGETADAELLNGYDTPSEQSSRKSPSVPASGGGRGRKRKSSVSAATPRKKGKGRKSVSVGLGDADEDGGWD